MQSVTKKWGAVIGGCLVLTLVGLGLALHSRHNLTPTQTPGQYVDPFSKETISNPPGKTPEKYGTASSILFLGFDHLLDFGIDTEQLANVELAFKNYSKTLAKPLSQVSIGDGTITSKYNSSDPNAPFVIVFKVQLNSKNIYQAEVIYTGLSDARLVLANPTDAKQIYDSGVIDSSSQR